MRRELNNNKKKTVENIEWVNNGFCSNCPNRVRDAQSWFCRTAFGKNLCTPCQNKLKELTKRNEQNK